MVNWMNELGFDTKVTIPSRTTKIEWLVEFTKVGLINLLGLAKVDSIN